MKISDNASYLLNKVTTTRLWNIFLKTFLYAAFQNPHHQVNMNNDSLDIDKPDIDDFFDVQSEKRTLY